MQRYRIAGLNVDSTFDFPNVAPRRIEGQRDILIDNLTGPEPAEGWTTYFRRPREDRSDLRFQPFDGLGFRILDGNRISVRREDSISDAEVNLYLMGTAWGMLCHQRGLLPLHCSAVFRNGRAYAFTGASGAGKSTLLVGLSECGYSHFCDDVMIVALTEDGPRAAALPKGLKLCEDALEFFSVSPGQQVSRRDRPDKFYVPVQSAAPDEDVEIGGLYVLSYHDDDSPPRIEQISGRNFWLDLYQSVYRVEFLPWINSPMAVSKLLATLIDNVAIYRFSRPRGYDYYQDGLDILMQHIEARAATSRDGAAE